MNKIKIRYKTETVAGEVLIFFCTVFYALAHQGIHDFVELVQSNHAYNGSTDFILNVDELKLEKMAANQTKRWVFPWQKEDKDIAVVVTSNHSNIEWFLYFRNATSGGPTDDFEIPEENVFNYTRDKSIGYSFDECNLGMYRVEIYARDAAWVSLFATSQNYVVTTSLIDIADKIERPRQMKVRFDYKENRSIVQWPKILDEFVILGLELHIAVSSEKYYKFPPNEAYKNCTSTLEEEDPNAFFLYQNVTSLKKFAIRGLEPNQIYFVTLFAASRAKLSVIYAMTSFKYQKAKPHGLKDGKLVQKSLKHNGGRLFYKFKVSNQRFQNFSGPLMWYVSRCCGKIWVKITHKKKVLEEKLITKYGHFIIKDLKPNTRYVMKIIDASRDLDLKFDDVEVLATMRPHLNSFFQQPTNLKVNLLLSRTKSTISWRTIASNEEIRYCIYTKEIAPTDLTQYKSMKIENQCNFKESKASYNQKFCDVRTYNSIDDRRLSWRVRGLNHTQHYAIQITAEKVRIKITVIYDLLLIPGTNVN